MHPAHLRHFRSEQDRKVRARNSGWYFVGLLLLALGLIGLLFVLD